LRLTPTGSLAKKARENAILVQDLIAGSASFGHPSADSDFKSSLNEEDGSYRWPETGALPQEPAKFVHARTGDQRGGGREVGQVPFSKGVFRDICQTLHIHPSISRAISRADVPLFSRAEVLVSQIDDDCNQSSNILNTSFHQSSIIYDGPC